MYHTKSEDEVCIVYLFGLKYGYEYLNGRPKAHVSDYRYVLWRKYLESSGFASLVARERSCSKKHGWGKCWYLPVRTKSYDNGKQVVTEKPLMKMVN